MIPPISRLRLPTRWLSIFKRNPFVLPMVVVAGLAILFISEGSYWKSQYSLGEIRGAAAARQSLATLERALADAETGQRGFLLTGIEEYLQPYQDGRRASIEALVSLERYFSRDAAARAPMTELRALTQAKLDELDDTVGLMRADQKSAALQMAQEGSGKKHMDRIRVLTTQLTGGLTQLRQSANQALDSTLLLSRYGVALLSGVLMLALLLYLRKSDALATVKTTQKDVLQAAHDSLEREVLQRTRQLTDLTRHLLHAREDERQRLARNLHDDLGSLLTAAKLDAARIRSRLGSAEVETQARLADLVDKLNSSIALGRGIIEDLRPSTLSHLGLAATLGILADEFAQRAGIPVHCQFESVPLTPAVELTIYRVVQEAMTNISKYAQATQVWIGVALNPALPDRVSVRVNDDGVGFDTQATSHSSFGLLGMRFRVEAEGGSLLVRSQPGKGTQLEVSLPARTRQG